MPYKVRKRGDKYRLIDENNRIAKNAAGTAIDGGGNADKGRVQSQAKAIMANKHGK